MNRAKNTVRVQESKAKTFAILNPLVQEITGALFELGGAAHRDLVVAHIAKKRGVYRPSPSMGEELEAAFATHCAAASDMRGQGLLHLPYGPSSLRWALTEQAYNLLRAGANVAAR